MRQFIVGVIIMFGLVSTIFGQKLPQGGGNFGDIYELLFCDNPKNYQKTESNEYPWSILKNPTQAGLEQIISDKASETRVKLVAYRILKEKYGRENPKELLGIVIEVPQPGGLDVLACYSDGTARYINQGKNLIVWETNDDKTVNQTIKTIFDRARTIFSVIGPWDKARLPAPKSPIVRISLLSPDGLYFGQGPSEIFFKDQMAGPTLAAATELLQLLTSKSEKK